MLLVLGGRRDGLWEGTERGAARCVASGDVAETGRGDARSCSRLWREEYIEVYSKIGVNGFVTETGRELYGSALRLWR